MGDGGYQEEKGEEISLGIRVRVELEDVLYREVGMGYDNGYRFKGLLVFRYWPIGVWVRINREWVWAKG